MAENGKKRQFDVQDMSLEVGRNRFMEAVGGVRCANRIKNMIDF